LSQSGYGANAQAFNEQVDELGGVFCFNPNALQEAENSRMSYRNGYSGNRRNSFGFGKTRSVLLRLNSSDNSNCLSRQGRLMSCCTCEDIQLMQLTLRLLRSVER